MVTRLSPEPLPDERPRQSVANLIGRFEQQTKRQSIGSTSPPSNGTLTPSRTSSVLSHTTGDSVKEELKASREWPPVAKSAPSSKPNSPPTSSILLTRKSTLSPPLALETLPPAAEPEPATPADVATPTNARSDPEPATATRASMNAPPPKAAPAIAAARKTTAAPRHSAPAKPHPTSPSKSTP
ncbi:hypothetical protein EVG20_g9477, partial [Dentipellis fragilis]